MRKTAAGGRPALDVAVAGLGRASARCRRSTSVPCFGRRQRRAHRLLEGRHVADDVVGRQHQQHRVAAFVGGSLERGVRRQRDGRRGVAARTARARWRAARRRSARSCSATRKRCASLHTTTGAAAARPVEAQRRLLQHRALAGERQQLLGIELARQRPQARAGAAGEDDWSQHAQSAPRSCREQRLAAADGVVGEAEAAHHGRVVEIAAVEDQRRLEQLLAGARSPGCGTPATR